MKKTPLSDGSGHWFDRDSAKEWKELVDPEDQWHRDSSDPHGESLFLTERGSFVLYTWNWRMADGLYHPIDKEKATRWLIANRYQKDIPKLELQAEERSLEI
jgi:hypothetical protein